MVVEISYKVKVEPVNAMTIGHTFEEPHRIHIATLERRIRRRLEDYNVLKVEDGGYMVCDTDSLWFCADSCG